MWTDSETNRDFLNFRTVADTAAEMIFRAKGKPLSMGVSGGWGVGKSSMVKLIQESLSERFGEKFVFVEFNAWLYQGFDDARAALMEVIAQNLIDYGSEHKKPIDQIVEFVSRINWIRAASLVGRAAAALKTAGISEVAIAAAGKALGHGDIHDKNVEAIETAGKEIAGGTKDVLKEKKKESPPREIQALRTHFAKILTDMEVTLVVFVDDLDRCLPDTAIETLEAMRLFLFMEHTAFVIAADEKMIRQAVRLHFKDVTLDDDLVTNYFDKLIQIPIRVPPLGTQEVRAYLFLLFIENSDQAQAIKDNARKAICQRLGETWQGKTVDREFVISTIPNCPDQLKSQFEQADRIAPILTSARQIKGNPRLIKRFLNTLYIRLAMASAQQVTVDEAALTKMLLFERCGDETAYTSLLKQINERDDGKPMMLKPWEDSISKGEKPELQPPWTSEFISDWLALPPLLHDTDLRSVAYVSREHMPIISRADQLSSEAAELLEALVTIRQAANNEIVIKLRGVGKRELSLMLEKLLTRAKQVTEWGVPPILHASMAIAAADANLAEVLSRFLAQLPPKQIKPAIVPLLKDKLWAQSVLKSWQDHPDVSSQVKNAIKAELKGDS
ncbi:MAG: ATPase [Pedosphaera sp.]|nr:ATPase [Pedosphaera sp.]